MPSEAARVVLVSESFPPAFGGSGELLANVYARFAEPVAVLAGVAPPGAIPGDDRRWASIERLTFGRDLGVLGVSPLRDAARLARRIARLSGAETVVYCGRALPEGTAAMTALRIYRGRPFVVWTHGEELPVAATSRQLSWLQRRVHRSAAALVANSRNTARLLEALGNPPSKIHVVHPGVDSERFRPDVDGAETRKRLAREDELLLLSVGRLTPRKGHDLVLRAIARLTTGEPKVRYVIVGGESDPARLIALATELGVMDQVTFVGEVPASELPSYYAAADVFAMPNRTEQGDFEGFGIVFLEAAASGLAAIGGRSGGVSEAIEDGVTGFLVSGDDADELASRLTQLFASRDLRARMGEAARARVLRDFTWARAARRAEEIDAAVRRGET